MKPRDVDALVASFREFVQALIDREQIAGGETVTQAQQNLCDALKRVLAVKIEEHAQ
jgi:hypothetical protein